MADGSAVGVGIAGHEGMSALSVAFAGHVNANTAVKNAFSHTSSIRLPRRCSSQLVTAATRFLSAMPGRYSWPVTGWGAAT